MHEAEHRVSLMVLQVPASAVARQRLQAPGGRIAHDLARQARFDRGENADQPLFDAVCTSDLAGDLLLACRTRRQVAVRRANAFDASLS
jgi:hypothetical protein